MLSSATIDRRRAVVYVSAVADIKGGAETVLLEMLRNPSVRPTLALPGPGGLEDFAAAHQIPVKRYDPGAVASVKRPVRVADLARAGRDAIRIARQLGAIAEGSKAEIVHANGLKAHVTGVVARLLHRTPTVVHMHDVPYSASERLIWRALSAGALHTIAGSELCYANVRRPARLSIVMQGVDTAPAAAPRHLPNRPVLGFVGRFHPLKGVHHLLEWFEVLASEFPQLTLLLRGRADVEGSKYWDGLQGQIARLAAQGRCKVDQWREATSDPFKDVDILIAPSVIPEVGPRVIMEAMLRAIPAIGYPAGGALSMIPSSDVGAHVRDATDLRLALRRLLNPDGYHEVSVAALRHAQQHFGIERFWQDIDAAYSTALRGVKV